MLNIEQARLIQTVLTQVAEFRSSVGFGNQKNNVHESLFASESVELLTAESWEEQADAVADMAVVMAGHYLNGEPYYNFERALIGLDHQAKLNQVNLLEAFKIVMVSNMSKSCKAEYKNATIQKYLSEGVRLTWVQRGKYWACYSADDMPDKPKGKLLKAVTYVEPDWSGDSWKL